METFNEDPKPGRLVLPLVLIGMIATTYTFINRVTTNNDLEIEPTVEDVAVTTEPDSIPDDTTTTTTTTNTMINRNNTTKTTYDHLPPRRRRQRLATTRVLPRSLPLPHPGTTSEVWGNAAREI